MPRATTGFGEVGLGTNSVPQQSFTLGHSKPYFVSKPKKALNNREVVLLLLTIYCSGCACRGYMYL